MDDQQRLRYSRHLLLNEFGEEAQERLLGAHALVVGAGGLGSAALMYLASSGMGRITVCDGDKVDLTNLQRQVVHRQESVGKPKAGSAAATLRAINPEIHVEPLEERAGPERLAVLVRAADVVLDCSDNFATRHALNRACVSARKLLVSGAGIRFDGQVAVFDLRRPDAPCYHCLFAEDARAEEERCATMGVFAPLVGMIGTFQALEAIKLVAGVAKRSRGASCSSMRSPAAGTRCGSRATRIARFVERPARPHEERGMKKILLAVAVAAIAFGASAQTMYKLIDKNGKVTYAEKPPKDFDGKVIRMDIDPNANTATLPKPTGPLVDPAKAATADNVKAAREKLEAAKKAYQNALDNPGDGELTYIGNKGGGTRPVQSEEYQKRLSTLEQAVKDAEEELKRAGG